MEVVREPIGTLFRDCEEGHLRVDTEGGWSDASVDHEKARDIVGLTVRIDNTLIGIFTHSTGAQGVGAVQDQFVHSPVRGCELCVDLVRGIKLCWHGVERHCALCAGREVQSGSLAYCFFEVEQISLANLVRNNGSPAIIGNDTPAGVRVLDEDNERSDVGVQLHQPSVERPETGEGDR